MDTPAARWWYVTVTKKPPIVMLDADGKCSVEICTGAWVSWWCERDEERNEDRWCVQIKPPHGVHVCETLDGGSFAQTTKH